MFGVGCASVCVCVVCIGAMHTILTLSGALVFDALGGRQFEIKIGCLGCAARRLPQTHTSLRKLQAGELG